MRKWVAKGIAVVAVLILLPLSAGWDYWHLATDGVETNGSITKVERWRSDYYVTYNFKDQAGMDRTGSQQIGPALYQEYAARSPAGEVKVHFCRTRPRISALSPARLRRDMLVSGSFVIVFCTSFFLVVFGWLGLAPRQGGSNVRRTGAPAAS